MTDPELVKLYLLIHQNGGWWELLIVEYRRRSASEASDASLRAMLSKRVGEIRWRLERLLGPKRALQHLPQLKRPPKRRQQREILIWFVHEALATKDYQNGNHYLSVRADRNLLSIR